MDSGWALWQIALRVQGWLLMGTSSIKIGYQYIKISSNDITQSSTIGIINPNPIIIVSFDDK